MCKDKQQKDLDDGLPGNQQFPHAPFSSSNAPLEANENGDLGDQMNQGVEQLENRPEEPPSSVGDDELNATRPKEEIKSEAHIPEDSRGNTVELECIVHKDEPLETDQQESECDKPSQIIKEETPLKSVSGSVHDEPDKPGEIVLDNKLKEEPVESSQTEKIAKTQGASASNKKKKKKKRNKQKPKQSDKQDNDTKIDDKNEVKTCSEDNPNQKTEGDLEENHQEPLGNDISETTMNTAVPHDDKRTSELDGIKTTSTYINADDVKEKNMLVTDEADLAGISKSISNFDCPESNNGILSDNLSSNVISNPTNTIDEHTEDSTIPDSETVVFSYEHLSSETKTSLPNEPSAQSMDAVEGVVESTTCSNNIEKSSSVDMKEVSHLNFEVEDQEENVQNLDLDGTTEDQDDSAHRSSPVMEKVKNEAERVIHEQPIDHPMENQLQDGIGAELNQDEVERQVDLDNENLKEPTEKVSDTKDIIGPELDQEEFERQDELDNENHKEPTEKMSDTKDIIGAGLDQEELERQVDLDNENLKEPTEKVSDTKDIIGAGLDQEELERQVDLDNENLKEPTEKVSDTKDIIGAELDQEENERQDELDNENHKEPTEKMSDTKDIIGAELDQEENERQDELDNENLKEPTEKVSDTKDIIGAELDQEENERQDELDNENLKEPTEKLSDTKDIIGAELDQEENERQDELDNENLKEPTEKLSDTKDIIGAELDQEEFERQDELDKENLKVPTEILSDGNHVDNTPLIETQVHVVHKDHLSPNKAIKESVGESDYSDQEPKVEKDKEEGSIQNQLEMQLPEDEEDLVKSDVAAQELKEEDEEDEGESFDFDEMDLEASSDASLKNFLDQPKEEGTLFKDDVQEASQEYQSNVTDEDQIQKEHLELADQESKPKEQKDDGQDTENPQTTKVIEGCLTEDSQISSEVKPNDQQHDTSGNKEEHQQASEDVTLSEGVTLISEIETRNIGQEMNSSIQYANRLSSISGDREIEKETTEKNKEEERKESKKSGKGKGKGKGKEECKMS